MFDFLKSKKRGFESPEEPSKKRKNIGESTEPKLDNSSNEESVEIKHDDRTQKQEGILNSGFGQETQPQEKPVEEPCSIEDLQKNLNKVIDSKVTPENGVEDDSKATVIIGGKSDVENRFETEEDEFYIKFEENPYSDDLVLPPQNLGEILDEESQTSKNVSDKTLYSDKQHGSTVYAWTPKKTFYPKPIFDEKLTIILVENTNVVEKEQNKLLKIINGLVTTGMICIINYGNAVVQSKIFGVSELKSTPVLNEKDIGDTSKFFDALVETEKLVSKKYLKTDEMEKRKVRFNEVEIIGIGTCKDYCSKSSKEDGINAFCKIIKNPNIVTKYFCLTEQSFLDAAEIGFHSIGAINRNYQ